MAHDSGRDILPVKDGAATFRSTDQRQFNPLTPVNYTAKLDRCELEDRYLRFVEENINLKKQCHNQEEKIRRLAAKLIRVIAEQRNSRNKELPTPKYSNLEVEDLITRVNELERSNQLLREKLLVAGIQLSTHHPPRISNKSPRRFGVHSASSGFSRVSECTTGSRPGTQVPLNHSRSVEQSSIPRNTCQFLEQQVSKLQNQLLNYEKELESVREENSERVRVLEDELTRVQDEGSTMAAALSAASAAQTSARNLQQTSRRVAENVEIIRLQRSIIAQEEQLNFLETERRKALDDAQIMSTNLQALQKENSELNEHLLNERKKISELQNEIQKLATNQLALQDMQEEVNDLKKEKSILQDANNKLLQSIMERGLESEPSNKKSVENRNECPRHICNCRSDVSITEELQRKELDLQQGKKDPKRMEEGENRKEKEIEKRVKELEEELNRKIQLEKEAKLEKEEEQQRERELELKAKEFEKQHALAASEQEKLKQQVFKVKSILKSSKLENDKLLEELKAQQLWIKELESNNSNLTAKLSAKNMEMIELQKIQKELMGNLKIDSATQYEEEEEQTKINLSLGSNETEHVDEMIDDGQERNLQCANVLNENGIDHKNVEESKEDNEITSEVDINILVLQQKLDEVSHELEKNKKLLQEQHEINSHFKEEVFKLSSELEIAHSKYDVLVTELKQKEDQTLDDSNIKKEEVQLQPGSNRMLTPGQCVFELNVDCILVSEEGKSVLSKMVGENSSPGIFLTWIFYEQEAAYTPIFQGSDGHIACSYSVVVPIKSGFFEYLDKEILLIELHAAIEDISVPVAYSRISFHDCLNYPQNKLYQSISLSSCPQKDDEQGHEKMSWSRDSSKSEFGILQYHFNLNCPTRCISEYKERQEKIPQQFSEDNNKNDSSSDIDGTINKKCEKEEDISSDSFSDRKRKYENSLAQDKLKSPPKPAPRNLKAPTKESVAINEPNAAPQIIIEIHSFRLLPESSAAKNPNIYQLFVEYTFLGKLGESMETPVSLPKPYPDEKLCFNFKKVFPMDPVENAMERNILQNMIHMKGSKRQNTSSLLAKGKVRFNVVSEPLEDDDSEAECIDIGYAEVSIPQILVNGEDIVEKDMKVINSDGSKEVIGYLNISFLAINVLQSLCGHF